MKIGAKINVFNANLRQTRIEKGYTQVELADAAGVPVNYVQMIEQLKMPCQDIDKVRSALFCLTEFLDVEFDYLFPPDYLYAIQEKLLPGKSNLVIFKDVDISAIEIDDRMQLPENIVEINDRNEKLMRYVNLLPTRERTVIKKRYGIGCEPRTYEETGKILGVSKERIRQIEIKAMRMLRSNKEVLELY